MGGAAAGFGAGVGNLFFRPMAGMLGVLVLPAVGAIRGQMRKGGPLMAARQAECTTAGTAHSGDEGDRVELLFRSLTTPQHVKQRRNVESMRRKEMAAASTLSELSPEEAQEMASRKWWKEAVPPPRPASRSRASSISSTPDMDANENKAKDPMAEAEMRRPGPSSASTSRDGTEHYHPGGNHAPYDPTTFPKSATPPPLPPRKRG